MKFLFRIIFLILYLSIQSSFAKGQDLIETELYGKWKVINVYTVKSKAGKDSKSEKQKMIFLKSTFRFDQNKSFVFAIENEEKDPEIEKMEIYGAIWRFEKSSRTVVITEYKEKDSDKYDLMEIKIERENQKLYFIISDTNFRLEVEKL